MSFNNNWPRWIFASCCKHFDANKGTNELHIESQRRKTNTNTSHIELRFDGPRFEEQSNNFFYTHIELNVLIHVLADMSDLHKIHRIAGEVAAIFTGIKLYRYGSGVGDDDQLFGCLDLIQAGRANQLEINHFGRIGKETDIIQASVEGHYQTHLRG